MIVRYSPALAAALMLAACGGRTDTPVSAGYGRDPTLPAPAPQNGIPTLNPAKAVGWPKSHRGSSPGCRRVQPQW